MSTPHHFAKKTYYSVRNKQPLPPWTNIEGTWDSGSIAMLVWSWATARVTDRSRFATMLSHAEKTDVWADKGRSMFLWSFAKVSFRDINYATLERMASFTDNHVQTQHWANAIWAFATLKATPTKRMIELARTLEFPPGELTTVCWSLATLSIEANLVMNVQFVREFGPGRIATMLWAIATQKKILCNADEITKTLAERCDENTSIAVRGAQEVWKPKELANVAWALATLTYKIPHCIVEKSLLLRLLPIDVVNLCWAHARTGQLDILPFLAKRAEEMTDAFSSRQLAQTAWALSKNREAFGHVAESFARRRNLRPCSPREVSSLLYAYAVCASSSTDSGAPFRYSVLLDWASQCSWVDASAQDLSNAAWALGKLNLWGAVIDNIASQVSRQSFPPQEFSNAVWGLSVLDNLPSSVLQVLPPLTDRRWTPQGVANTVWALGRHSLAVSWPINQILSIAADMNDVELGMTMYGLHSSNHASHLFFSAMSTRFLALQPNGGATVDFLAGREEDDPVRQYCTRTFVTPVIELLRNTPQHVEKFMQTHTLPHAGHGGTRHVLEVFGILAAPSPPQEILHRLKSSSWRHRSSEQALWPLPSTRTVTAAIWQSSNPSWRVFTSDDYIAETTRDTWAIPAFVNCARHDHAERVALLHVAKSGHMDGEEIRIFVSHWPCMSCVKVLTGFKRAFPNCMLRVSWPT